MTAYHLDGNAYAGLLVEVFGTEMTSVVRACQSCGARNPVGAHRAYPGASPVLRCPACGDLALRITTVAERHVIQIAGTWMMDLPPRVPKAATWPPEAGPASDFRR